MRAMVVLVAALAASPLVANQRLETRVEIALRPIKTDGTTRLYPVVGRREPVFWDQVFPIPIGDVVEVRALPISGERRIDRAVFRLDGADYESFCSLPPYEVAIDTENMDEGWHQVEIFCQQESSHPMRASGSVKFLLVRQLENPESAKRIAALERAIAGLKANHAKQVETWKAEKARREAQQAAKAARWKATRIESVATDEPVAATPQATGTLVAWGGTNVGTLPSGKKVVLTGAVTPGLGTAVAPVALTVPMAEPRQKKIDLKNIGEVVILGQGQVRLDYRAEDGRNLSKIWQVNQQLTLRKVSVPLIVIATLGNRRVSRELTLQNPTAVFNLTKEVSQ